MQQPHVPHANAANRPRRLRASSRAGGPGSAFPEFWMLNWPQRLRGGPAKLTRASVDCPQLTAEVKDDIQAAQAFLEMAKRYKAHKDYVLEVERLYYWVFYAFKKPVAKFTYADRRKFEDFLRNPEPDSFWCGPHSRAAPRHSPDWRPFAPKAEKKSGRWIDPVTGKERDNQGLSEPSIRRATLIISQYFEWLVDEGYLRSNPWTRGYETRRERKARRDAEASRRRSPGESLRLEDWKYVLMELDKRAAGPNGPQDPEFLRLKCLTAWVYYMNPSDEVMATTRDCDLIWFLDGDEKVAIWRTSRVDPFARGKTIFEWHILHDAMVATYLAWKKSIGWGSFRDLQKSTEPVFRALKGPSAPMTRNRLHDLILDVFRGAGQLAVDEHDDPDAARRLQAATDSRRRHLLPNIDGVLEQKLQDMTTQLQVSRSRANYYASMDSTNPTHALLR